ncbi:MAG: SDR family NAD(P)-dependent oxidoreductase [Clostridiales bacterium]|nr:SDR family NAD(P)-dependent oxidoreductase [Clostridiales bacterium]
MKNRLPDLGGRTAVVTGTGGIGYEAAFALAGAGADVIIAGRNAQEGARAAESIRAAFPGASVRFEPLDLMDSGSIAAFCGRMEEGLKSLHILMCIAGLMMPDDLKTTEEGVESQFAVNYLGHFALTAGLFPLLKAAGCARVVTVSSIANRPVRFDLRDATAARGYSASVSYALSKLSCLMFAIELARRSEEGGWGVFAYGVHPGLARTRLFHRSHGFTMTLLQCIFFILPFIRQSAKNAAKPALFAAASRNAVSGGYYGPWFLGVMGPPRRALKPLRAKNPALRKELWDLSVSLTGKDIIP